MTKGKVVNFLPYLNILKENITLIICVKKPLTLCIVALFYTCSPFDDLKAGRGLESCESNPCGGMRPAQGHTASSRQPEETASHSAGPAIMEAPVY